MSFRTGPGFDWNRERLAEPLAAVRHRQGRLIGHMEALGFNLRQEAVLQTLTADVLKSSEIEGEKLDAEQVRSSIARRLGMDIGALKPADRNVEGIVEMMLDATRHYDQPLTAERLFAWHASLFPTGRSGMSKIRVGAWRDDSTGPMEVVSGPAGKERVHFQAPTATRLDGEMKAFLDWFNADADIDPVLKAGLAHLWFVTIHPFDDGNGRIARAIADMALARSENSPQRFYSMSAQIRQERDAYYDILERDAERNDGYHASGWNGSSAAWAAPSTARKPLLALSSPRRASGRLSPASRSTTGSALCSTACWMASRASSRHRNMPSSPSAPRIRPCVTSCLSLNAAFSSATRKAGGARAMRLPWSHQTWVHNTMTNKT